VCVTRVSDVLTRVSVCVESLFTKLPFAPRHPVSPFSATACATAPPASSPPPPPPPPTPSPPPRPSPPPGTETQMRWCSQRCFRRGFVAGQVCVKKRPNVDLTECTREMRERAKERASESERARESESERARERERERERWYSAREWDRKGILWHQRLNPKP
jgi:type IV secretory pathway VirB10-like protein